MKPISATPETIRKIFSGRYVIPDFQRPYSWEEEQCEKLWTDVVEFFENKDSEHQEQYFIGSIVVNQAENSPPDTWEVVDGQQRLTTLLLLIKALYSRAGTYTALEECLRIKNHRTGDLTNELRVCSKVTLNDDKDHLERIILQNEENFAQETKLFVNYRFLKEKIGEWLTENDTSETLEKLIDTLLDSVVLLPIQCGDTDDALKLFEIINDRGKPLSDPDIFKAKLYGSTMDKGKQKEFIEEWNALKKYGEKQNEKHYEWLFRILMHVFRAEENIRSKEIGVRSFFTEKSKNRLSNSEKVMDSLKVLHAIDGWYGSDEISGLWAILRDYPNQMWNFPLYVFLHKYGAIGPDTGEFELPTKMKKQFVVLLEETVKYFYIKGIVHKSINPIKDTIYHVCADIELEGDYLSRYTSNLKDDDYAIFSSRLEDKSLGRYVRGLVLLSAYLNPRQNKADFAKIVWGKCEIEHILPKKWNNYDGWTEESWREKIDTLGNLAPLGKELNIAAKNEFFDRKREIYQDSKIQDILDVAKEKDWTPKQVAKYQEVKMKRLLKWFGLPER